MDKELQELKDKLADLRDEFLELTAYAPRIINVLYLGMDDYITLSVDKANWVMNDVIPANEHLELSVGRYMGLTVWVMDMPHHMSVGRNKDIK